MIDLEYFKIKNETLWFNDEVLCWQVPVTHSQSYDYAVKTPNMPDSLQKVQYIKFRGVLHP